MKTTDYRLLKLGERLKEIDKEHYLDNLTDISTYHVGSKVEESFRFYREIVSYKDKGMSNKKGILNSFLHNMRIACDGGEESFTSTVETDGDLMHYTIKFTVDQNKE